MKKVSVLVGLLAIVGAFLLLWRQFRPPTITVGVDAPLTATTVFDPSEMNAAELFLKEHPRSRIRVHTMYYELKPERSPAVFQEAMGKGVRFFITTQPSTGMMPSMHLFADSRALVINTSSATPEITGKDDFLLRIIPDAVQEQRALARHINKMPGNRLLVIQDAGNPLYTDPAFAVFSAELGALGRWQVVHRKLVIADFKPADYRLLMAERFDALYILAGDFQISIGNIAQLFHHLHPEATILLTPWARSPAILETAGDAVDRIILSSNHPFRHQNPGLDDYYRRFRASFGYDPLATAIMVRQALELLDQACAKGYDTPEKVKQYLLSTPTHQTSLGPISFDRHGDVTGTFFFSQDLKKELK